MAAALTLAALAVGGLTAPDAPTAWASRDDNLKRRQADVEKKIDEAHHDLDDSSAQLRRTTVALRKAEAELADARDTLADAESRLSAAKLRDQQMQDALDAAEAKLAAAEAEVEQGRRDTEAQREKVEEFVVSGYEQGDPDLLAIEGLMNSETAQDLAFNEIADDAIAGDQTMAYDELRAALVLLRVREAKVEQARDDVADKRQQAADALAETQAITDEARRARDQVAALVDSSADAKARADRARAADRRILEQLQAQESRIQERIRQRQLAALRRARARQAASARRTASTGTLGYPVSGAYITSPFGYRIHPIYGYYGLHDGTDFSTGGCGAPLRATTDGVVVERYWSDVYGNRLYLDNGIRRGVGLTSVYNHASSYTVGVGEHVERGEIIGYLGDTGWSTACHLHFTLLRNGVAVNPANWF